MASLKLIHIIRDIIYGYIGCINHGVRCQPRRSIVKCSRISYAYSLAVQLKSVQVDGEVAHLFLHESYYEENAHNQKKSEQNEPPSVHSQQCRTYTSSASVGDVHADYLLRIHVTAGLAHEFLKLPDTEDLLSLCFSGKSSLPAAHTRPFFLTGAHAFCSGLSIRDFPGILCCQNICSRSLIFRSRIGISGITIYFININRLWIPLICCRDSRHLVFIFIHPVTSQSQAFTACTFSSRMIRNSASVRVPEYLQI